MDVLTVEPNPHSRHLAESIYVVFCNPDVVAFFSPSRILKKARPMIFESPRKVRRGKSLDGVFVVDAEKKMHAFFGNLKIG